MSKLELRVPPIFVILICLIGMWFTAGWTPDLTGSFAGAHLLASLFVLLGMLLPVLSVVEFRRAKTTLDPRFPEQSSQLVTRGVFAMSRNPIYLGFVLLLIGVACLLANLVAVCWVVAFVLYMTRFQIQPEERYMREKFGDDFLAYSSKVRRWF